MAKQRATRRSRERLVHGHSLTCSFASPFYHTRYSGSCQGPKPCRLSIHSLTARCRHDRIGASFPPTRPGPIPCSSPSRSQSSAGCRRFTRSSPSTPPGGTTAPSPSSPRPRARTARRGPRRRLPAARAAEQGFFDFSQAKADGEDIRFSADGKPLAYQIEEWDPAAGSRHLGANPGDQGQCPAGNQAALGQGRRASESNGAAVFNESNGYVSVLHWAHDRSGQGRGRHGLARRTPARRPARRDRRRPAL